MIAVLVPGVAPAQIADGKWCASYNSANGDGQFVDCILFHTTRNAATAVRWLTAQCTSVELCSGGTDPKPRVSAFPKRVHAADSNALLRALGVAAQTGTLVEKGASPRGEDVIFERETAFVMRPSFDCAKAPAAAGTGHLLESGTVADGSGIVAHVSARRELQTRFAAGGGKLTVDVVEHPAREMPVGRLCAGSVCCPDGRATEVVSFRIGCGRARATAGPCFRRYNNRK